MIHDPDQYSTDLGKCLKNIEENEQRKDAKVRLCHLPSDQNCCLNLFSQYRVMLLGGLTGRLDQTAHTLSVLSKQSRSERTVWAFSEMSMACVLQKVC